MSLTGQKGGSRLGRLVSSYTIFRLLEHSLEQFRARLTGHPEEEEP